MLAKQGILSDDEATQIAATLGEIEAEIEQGRMPFRIELEDIHMHIEQALIERLGDVDANCTQRARNDQVSTDLRLWVRTLWIASIFGSRSCSLPSWDAVNEMLMWCCQPTLTCNEHSRA